MKKRLWLRIPRFAGLTLIASSITLLGFSQAVLPTSWNFATTNLPTGWTSSGAGFAYYSGSGNPAPAAKFSNGGDKLTINFNSTPGTLQYDIVGNPPPATSWSGTFTVEESVNGTSWTTVATYTALVTTYTTFSNNLNSASRYARFNFTTKTNGNVGLDNVSISAGVSTVQEISVSQSSTTIVNGGTYTTSSPVSVPLPINFTIQNLGTVGTLSVTATNLSGPAASDYSVTTSMPIVVAPTSSATMTVNFTPASAGTRNAVLTITNNDPTGNPYIINLNGIGGNLATEPTAQPSNLTFPVNKSYHIQSSFTAASPACDGYLVLRKTSSAVTDVPVDGTVYQRGDMIGTSKVVYSSNSTGFFPNEIIASTHYYFAVFAYNGISTYRNYLTVSPLTGNITTSGSMQPANYYNSISTSNATFVTDLHTLVNPHTIQLYGSYGPLMVSDFYCRDTTADQRVVTCAYSGENKVYTDPFDWTTDNFSREHTYCQSWQPTVNDPNFQNRPEYNDYHMITPTDQNNVNAIRSNYPLGVVVGTPSYTYLGCKLGNDSSGHKVFEPRDSDKGDAARCMFYQCIAYTGVAYTGPANTNATYGGSWSLPNHISTAIPYGQDQNILKQWNTQDPPDNFEIARNDYVDSLQGNRNPFIDHPEFVCYIDFSNMTYSNCSGGGVNELYDQYQPAVVYPNPVSSSFTILISENKNEKAIVSIENVIGQKCATFPAENNSGTINCPNLNLPNGLYMVKVNAGDKMFLSKILINK